MQLALNIKVAGGLLTLAQGAGLFLQRRRDVMATQATSTLYPSVPGGASCSKPEPHRPVYLSNVTATVGSCHSDMSRILPKRHQSMNQACKGILVVINSVKNLGPAREHSRD